MNELGKPTIKMLDDMGKLHFRIQEMEDALVKASIAKRRSFLANTLKDELLKPASLTEKLELITESVVQIFEADFSRIWLIKPGDKCDSGCVHASVNQGPHVCIHRHKCLHLVASSGRYTHIDGIMHARVPFGCYKIGRIASGADPKLLTNDVCSDLRIHDHHWAKDLGLMSFGGYRIISRPGVPIGVLALFSQNYLSDDDSFLMETIANTAAHVFLAATMEEAAISERLRFQRLAENSPFGTLTIEKDGSFSYANPKFKEMFGYDLKDVPNGREWFRKVYPDPRLRHEVIASWIDDFKSHAPGESAPKIFPAVCADGSQKIIHFRHVKLESGQNLMTCEDITELKRAEEEMKLNEVRLKKIIEILHYSPDSLQDFMDFALNEAVKLTRSKIGYIFHYDEKTRQFTLNTWSRNVFNECRIAEPPQVYNLEATGIWGDVVRSRQPMMVNDFQAAHPSKKGHPDGHVLLSRYLSVPVFRKDEIVGVVGLANKEFDYTQSDILQLSLLMDSVWKCVDRLEAEVALEEREATLKTVLQSAPIGVGLVTDRVFGWINETITQMTGYSSEELIGKSARLLYESDDEFLRVGTLKYRQVESQGYGSIETRWKCKDGSLVDILLSSSAIVPGDLSRGVVFSALDMTDRRRSEQGLREAEERMRLLIESAPIAIRIATQGKYSYVNPAFLKMFGYDAPDEIEGLPVDALYVESDRRIIRERNENRARGLNVDSHYRVTGIKKDGAHLDLEAWGSEIIYRGERSTLRFLIDVTESNSLRAQLLQAQKMEAVGTLVGGIAHDFNNLLQAVLGYSELMLKRKNLDQGDHNNITKIYQAATRGADLVKSLMTLSQKAEINYVPTDLNHEIVEVSQLLSRTIPKTIKIELKLSEELEAINASPSHICQVLMNIGVNARDAMPYGGLLRIETSNVQLDDHYSHPHLDVKPGTYVLLYVSDTGFGMNATTLSRVFEPFFTTKETGKGTGLGLATVYGIVKQHGGHISCSSRPGIGTSFRIYFPAIKAVRASRLLEEDAVLKGGSETILLVEDDESVRELCRDLLTSFGYNVMTAHNGRDALDLYRKSMDCVSMIILDLIMPVMDGKQCLDEILQINPAARVLIASGYSEEDSIKPSCLSGAKTFVRKPYNINELLNSVRRILDN